MAAFNKQWQRVRRRQVTQPPKEPQKVWQWEDPVAEGWLTPQAPWTLYTILLWVVGIRGSAWPPRHVDPKKVQLGVALHPLPFGDNNIQGVVQSRGQPFADAVPVGGFLLYEATEGVSKILVRRRVL